MHWENEHTSSHNDPEVPVFMALEKFFVAKGNDRDTATMLAYKALDVLTAWYDEKNK